jgi:flagellar biosynthetic protein FliQ
MFIEAILLVIMLSALPLVSSMVIGLIVSVLQAATQIQEQTLSFVPKLLAVTLAIYFFGPWMVSRLITFSGNVMEAVILVSRVN